MKMSPEKGWMGPLQERVKTQGRRQGSVFWGRGVDGTFFWEVLEAPFAESEL